MLARLLLKTGARYLATQAMERAIFIGGGIAGLYAALHLQDMGKPVTVLEKRKELGGPCGHVVCGDVKFELANQVGTEAAELLKESGVKVDFVRVTNEMLFPDGTVLTTPVNAMTLWNLLYPSSIFQLWRMMKRGENTPLSLATRRMHPKFGRLALGMFGYPAANPRIDIKQLMHLLADAGGYTTPMVPVGGMPHVIDMMAQRVRDQGGEVRCDCEVREVKAIDEETMLVRTPTIDYIAERVFSSVHGWGCYPKNAVPGLPLTALFLETDGQLSFPAGVHTIAFLPEDVADWFAHIDSAHQGEPFPEQFGFHCFMNQGGKGITVFIPSPRSSLEISEQDRQRIIDKIFATMERRIVGLGAHIRQTHVVSPQDFSQRLGLSSKVPPFLLPEGVELPIRDLNTGVYLLGSAVYPSSPNIFGALKSVDSVVKAAYASLEDQAVQQSVLGLKG